MYTQDKITKGGEITAAGTFMIGDRQPFYIFIVATTDAASASAVMTGRIVYNKEDTPVPLVAGMWNPVVLSSAEITEDMLSNYRIFYGQEG